MNVIVNSRVSLLSPLRYRLHPLWAVSDVPGPSIAAGDSISQHFNVTSSLQHRHPFTTNDAPHHHTPSPAPPCGSNHRLPLLRHKLCILRLRTTARPSPASHVNTTKPHRHRREPRRIHIWSHLGHLHRPEWTSRGTRMCSRVGSGRVRRDTVSLPLGRNNREESINGDSLGVGAVYAHDGLRSVRRTEFILEYRRAFFSVFITRDSIGDHPRWIRIVRLSLFNVGARRVPRTDRGVSRIVGGGDGDGDDRWCCWRTTDSPDSRGRICAC